MQENMVITGGKESRTYGIVLQTGQINYECSMNECTNFQEASSQDMLVVQRNTQTVRAHVPRTGEQKWNFSVSLHDVAYHPAEDPCEQNDGSDEEQNEIISEKTPTTNGGDDFTLKAIVPDGLICATDEQDLVRWRRKFPSPIVDVWRLREGGRLERVDLFSKQHIPPRRPHHASLLDDDDEDLDEEDAESPFLYIGSHQSQLYIQESVRMRAEADAAFMTVDSPELGGGGSSLVAYPRVTWRPYLVRSVVKKVLNSINDSSVSDPH
jgi:translation initiation factor 2-alpha kinase 3